MLEIWSRKTKYDYYVSVAGCLGYDVLASSEPAKAPEPGFSCWLFRL